MLYCTKETEKYYCEDHTTAEGWDKILVEIYKKTPNGRFCERSITMDYDEFHAMSDEELNAILEI